VLRQNDTIDIWITIAMGWWWQLSVATVILSSNSPTNVIDACCYCGSSINKPLHDLLQTLIPGGFHSRCQFAQISLELTLLLTSPEPVSLLSPSWSLRAVVESSPEPPRCRSRPRSSPFTRRHLPWLEPFQCGYYVCYFLHANTEGKYLKSLVECITNVVSITTLTYRLWASRFIA
jgi:hypothetical protein